MKFYAYFIFIFVLIASFSLIFSGSLNALHSQDCIIVENGCASDTNISGSKFCKFSIDSNVFNDTYESVVVNITQGGMLNSDRDFSLTFDENTEDSNFAVWVDKYTQPTYITCKGIETSGDEHSFELISLGHEDNSLKAEKSYIEYDRDDSEIYFIGFGLIIIALFSMFILAMNRRKT